MTPKARTISALNGAATDRPLFCPAIYEHKARLIDKSPSEVARDGDLLRRAVLAEYETYQPDMLTVGIDVYNIEAEALGSGVQYPEQGNGAPAIVSRVLSAVAEVAALAAVDVERAGRMPLMLQAAEQINKEVGAEVFVRGAVTGPFSLAGELVGLEQLLMAALTEPKAVEGLLEFCTQVGLDYGRAFLKRGIEVCVFDSQAAPPFVSPQLYREMLLPQVRKLFAGLKEAGATFVEYVVGGDTSVYAESLVASGADIILCDFVADVEAFLPYVKGKGKLVRRNIDPRLIEMGSEEELAQHVREVAAGARSNYKIIVGTGVISYNTPPDRVLSVKSMCMETFGQK